MKSPAKILLGCLIVILLICFFLLSHISQLKQENLDLHQQVLTEKKRTQNLAAELQASASEQPRDVPERPELARAPSELQQFEQGTIPSKETASRPSDHNAQISTETPSQIVQDILQGDMSGLLRLAELTKQARQARLSGEADLADPFSEIKTAFKQLGIAAGNHDPNAIAALYRATFEDELAPFAVHGLGQAAGLGHEGALEILLAPAQFGLLESSTIGALKPAADAGHERAIAAFAEIAYQPKKQALWHLTTEGLKNAAAAGNPVAIDGLVQIARVSTNSVATEGRRVLERAAFVHQQPLAQEALQPPSP